jgi:hypothetical protein
MKLFIKIFLASFAFFFLFSSPAFACVAGFDSNMTYPFTGDTSTFVVCQGSSCNSPSFYAGYPELYTVNSTTFDSSPFSGTRHFNVNVTTHSVGQNITGISVYEDGNLSQCASGYFTIVPAVVPPEYFDTTVKNTFVDTISLYKTHAFALFVNFLGTAIAFMATPALVRWGIKKFRKTGRV